MKIRGIVFCLFANLLIAQAIYAQTVLANSQPASAVVIKKIKLDNGISLEYAEQGDAKGPVVLMLHGITDSRHSYDLLMPHLPASIHAVALTLRGHGNSDHPEKDYTIRDFSKDVAQFIQKMNWKKVTLVGHSMSGVIAQQCALDFAELVENLVIVSSDTFFADNAGMDEFQKLVNQLTDPVPMEFAREFQISTIANPIPDSFLELFVNESLKLKASTWKLVLNHLFETDLRPRHNELKMPVYLFWGDKDAICDMKGQQEMINGISNLHFFKYAGIGHALHWEAPQRFAVDLINLLH